MAQSALFGRPPVTEDDYWIVKGLLFRMGHSDMDPAKGLPLPQIPTPPHDNRSGSIVAGIAISIFVIVIITATRVLSRKMMRTSSLGWDDLLIVVAAFAAVSWFGITAAMVSHGGAGQHLYNLTYRQWYWFQRLGAIAAIMLYVTSSFTKFSIIFFNIRLTGLTSITWIWVHRIFFALVLAYALLSLFWFTLSCDPPATTESLVAVGKAAPNIKCNKNLIPVAYALCFLHPIFDWLLLAVPIIVLFQLKMSWQKKARCITPLAIGALSAIGASRRTYDAYHPPADLPYHFPFQFPYNILDMVCAVCVTSLPAVNNLLIFHLPKNLSERWSSLTSPSADAYASEEKAGPGKTKGGNIDEETSRITVKRDVDLESVRTEHEETSDPGYLELNQMHRPNVSYVGT